MRSGDRLGHYTIVSLIGAGGMGAVYRATDTVLGRDVALKVLPPDMAGDPERLERFRREARAVASLSHPNIVTIHSVEYADGSHFFTMELLAGRTLEAVIADGALAVERVREIGRQIADALATAHDSGIVHRDLKPANVIVDAGGRVKVLDFGLAKGAPVTSPAGPDAPTAVATQLGAVLGTPRYMSPEQVRGLDVDHRTDIFSFGVVLYEMAVGSPPFRGPSAAELASSILRDTPPPVSTRRPAVPPDIVCVITRCLEKEPSARFASMSAVAAALRQPVTGRASDGASVAVLPFESLSADPEDELFAHGLAEELLNALAQIDGLRVAARTSSFSFRGTTTGIADIGSALGVVTVLEGSVRRAGNRVRVTVKLVDVANGFQIWSERYDREIADIFDLQDQIARAIAERLMVTLTAADSTRIVKAATTSVEAYEVYLRGRALLLKRGRHVADGIDCLQRAVELDPRFAAAWAGLADAHAVRGYWGVAPPGDTMPKALTAARRAVGLDPDLAEGQSALAIALLLWERDYAAAGAAFERCLRLNPGYTQGRCWYALFYLQWVSGRLDEGVAEARRALAADPLSAYATAILAFCLATAGRHAEALDAARLGAARDPDSFFTHWVRALAAHWQGACEESIEAFSAAAAVSAQHPYTLVFAAAAHAACGRAAAARNLHEQAVARSACGYVPRAALAVSAAAVGDVDLALDLSEEACDEREPLLIILARAFPDWNRLRQDPRFADIRRRLALP